MSENNLVFTRRVGETIIIGDNTTITVLGIKGGTVKLGIYSPEKITADAELKQSNFISETAT